MTGNVTGTVSSIANHSTSDLSEGTNLYYTTARFDTAFSGKDTDDLTEGSTNFYYTTTRANTDFDTRLGTKDTDNLSEGSSNLYHTTERVQDVTGGQFVTNGTHTGISFTYDDSNDGAIDATVSLSGFSTSDLSEGSNLYYTTGRFDTRFTSKDTDDLSEGSTNLYYTDARSRAAVSATGSSGLTYDSSTGAFNLSAIPNSNLANSSVTINSNALALGGTLTLDTDDIGEGSNQYFTTARVDTHLSGGTGIDYSSGAISIDSTVVTETSTDTLTNKTINFENNTAIIEVDVTVSNSSGNNKYLLDGETSASLQLIPGVTYRFDQSDSSNSGHPFVLSTTLDGTHNSGANYTMGVTTNGSPGSSGAYTQIVVDASTSDRLFYYCSAHSGMGGGVIETQGSAIVTFAVTVANVSGNKYHLDGETSASVQLVPGTVYRFDQSDSSNSGHPLKLSATKDGTHNSGSEYTTNVVTSGTPGTADSYTEIVVNAATADTLYYYCSSHSGMGGDSVVSVQGVSLSDSDTDDLTEGSSNLYFTNARARSAVSVTDSGGDGSLAYNSSTGVFTYTGPSAAEVRAHISGGTGVTVSSGQISIGQAVATNSDVTFNDLIVSGDLTVSGTTTTLNTETLTVDDNIIVLNNNVTGTPSENGGIEIERGSSTNKTFIWNETDDKWTIGSETFVAGTVEANLTGNVTGNVTGTVSSIANHDTDSLSEGSSNLYYTNSRFDTRFGTKDTDNLSEGSTNLYFSDERVDDRVNSLLTAGANISLTYNDAGNSLTIASTDTNTQLSQEEVEDYVGGLITAGSGISVTYDDAAGTLTLANTASTSTEDVQDIVGAQIVTNGSHTGISFAYDDSNDGAIDATVSLSSFDTDNLSEGSTNLYYTDARFDTRLGTKTTTNLSEGTNLYFTNARADARISAANLEDLSNVGFSTPGASEDDKVVFWDNTAGAFGLSTVAGLAGQGEVNTASNIGTAGVGIFDGKVGEDLQFKKLNSGSSKITITDDTSNNEVDVDLGTVSINDLSDVITTSVADGQALIYSNANSRFQPGDVTATLSGLTDTTISSLATGELLQYNGSAWVNAVPDSDDLTEGSTNLFYTNARARGAVSAASGSGLSYNSSTGEFTTSSIPNTQLANSSITVTDGSNSTATSLGGTITFSGTSNEVEVAESSGTITVGLPNDITVGNDLTVTNDLSVTGDTSITGNLTVSGTTTTVNSNNVNIGDSVITLNSDEAGTPSQDGGIEIERGTATNKTLVWDETNDKWTVGSETFVAATFEGTATSLATSFTTGLTADSSPADDDLFIVYDTSAGTYKKVAKSNISSSSEGALTGEAPLTLADGTTSDPIEFLNLGSTGTDIDVTLTDGTVDPIQITSTSAAATAFRDGDNDTKIQVEATTDADDIRMSTAGTERLRIESDGVVDVKSAKLKINGGAGTNGQVLTTDGSGTISWADSGGSVGVNDLTDASTAGLATGDSLVYDGSNFVAQRPTNIEDADGDTRIHVEESADEDKVRIDTGGTERMIIDNNATMSANGGFFLHRTTLASGESFTISANTGTVAAGPLDIEGTVDVAGTLVVV